MPPRNRLHPETAQRVIGFYRTRRKGPNDPFGSPAGAVFATAAI